MAETRTGVLHGAMYATCLHCNATLGYNAVVEHFPVGRRLAFDAAKGRLWVVCPKCTRWNLTPLESRWEAIEECEKLFRDTRLRSSTDNIGLARVGDGLDLVRIGRPLVPEFAAWRYGSELLRRWKLQHARFVPTSMPGLTTVSLTASLFYIGSGSAIASAVYCGVTISTSIAMGRLLTRDVRARVVLPGGQVTDMRALALSGMSMSVESSSDGGWSLRCTRDKESHVADETEASHTLRGVLAYQNGLGADADAVAGAVKRIQSATDARAFINRTARAAAKTGVTNLRAYPAEALLALEMALHDESERRALDGELDALADEWELAEEVAKVADDMFLPESVVKRLETLKSHDRDRPQ